MDTILNFMANDHRTCDDSISQFEVTVSKKNWEDAAKQSEKFITEMNRHLNFEEDVLFPAFEQSTGMNMGPTMVMRSEHSQMREIFDEIKKSVNEKNSDRTLGLIETLMIFIQQHNNKEEQMLYRMCDMHLQDVASDLLKKF